MDSMLRFHRGFVGAQTDREGQELLYSSISQEVFVEVSAGSASAVLRPCATITLSGLWSDSTNILINDSSSQA